jgi:hypothetical protein
LRLRLAVFPGKSFFKNNPCDFGQKKRRASFGEGTRRFVRFFCPKSYTGTAGGVPSRLFAVART